MFTCNPKRKPLLSMAKLIKLRCYVTVKILGTSE